MNLIYKHIYDKQKRKYKIYLDLGGENLRRGGKNVNGRKKGGETCKKKNRV